MKISKGPERNVNFVNCKENFVKGSRKKCKFHEQITKIMQILSKNCRKKIQILSKKNHKKCKFCKGLHKTCEFHSEIAKKSLILSKNH